MNRQKDLKWVDDFIESIRPYVRVREEDNLFILMPNQVYRLNLTAVKIMKYLLSGGRIKHIEKRISRNEKPFGELFNFFCDINAIMRGCLHAGQKRKAVDEVPFETPFSMLPVLSEIALTYRCNLRCAFCYASCNCTRRDLLAEEMTTRQVKLVIDKISEEAKVPSMSFTGGEPTLRADLPQLIRYARKKEMRVNLITNGTLCTKKFVTRLVRAGLNSVQVSLEGPTPQLHDSVTGSPGSFEGTIHGIKNFVAAGIHTHTNTTINRRNAAHCDGLLELIKNLGLDKFSMNVIIPSGAGDDNYDALYVHYGEIGDIVRNIRKKALKLGLEFMWYSPTPLCMFNPIAEGLGNKACACCDGLLSVSPSGDILPCSSYPESVGNLLTADFLTIWHSPKARYFTEKKFIPPLCDDCTKRDLCAGACPLYWAKNGYAELEEVVKADGVPA